jgi:DAK2 domain fusion protein YloV
LWIKGVNILHSVYIMDGEKLKQALKAGFSNLVKQKEKINYLNVFPVPDGDTGTNMFLTVSSAVKEAESVNSNNVGNVVKAMSKGALMGARGNSGVILSQLFRGFASALEHNETIDYRDFVRAFDNAVKLAYKAVLKPVEGTILTVSKAVVHGIKDASYTTKDITVLLKKGLEAGEHTLNKTPEMLPVLAKAGVVDAGGQGLIVMLQGALAYLEGKQIDDFLLEDKIQKDSKILQTPEEIGAFNYCTECVIKGKDLLEDIILDEIKELGDSTLVVGSKELIKIHIHTNNPGRILEICLKYGSLHDIKIDNMLDQTRDTNSNAEQFSNNQVEKNIGLVAVTSGDGLKKIFQSMGVDIVIEGGQTMNPSTEDILSAIEKVNSKSVLVLPNNKNIIMAAEQAAKLSTKSVKVVPTKTFPQGMAALLGYDINLSFEENYNNMLDHFEDVLTGEVTYAVRDTNYGDMIINENDILGILEGEIIQKGKDIHDVTSDLLSSLVEKNEAELITLFYGDKITEDEVNQLKNEFINKYPDVELEVYRGGQPLYYYIISAE